MSTQTHKKKKKTQPSKRTSLSQSCLISLQTITFHQKNVFTWNTNTLHTTIIHCQLFLKKVWTVFFLFFLRYFDNVVFFLKQTAEGCVVTDPEGKKYYDFLSAYSAVNQGHCHPKIIKALCDQAQKLTLSSRAFHNSVFGPWSKFVTDFFGYECVLPMNTGAEAVETGLKVLLFCFSTFVHLLKKKLII